MKKLVASCMVVVLCGCAGLYSGIVTVTEVRDSAMKELAQLNKAGKMSAETYAKVEAADLRYRQAAEVASKALVAYKNGGDQVQYVTALQAVKAAVVGILDILTPMVTQSESIKLQNLLSKASVP